MFVARFCFSVIPCSRRQIDANYSKMAGKKSISKQEKKINHERNVFNDNSVLIKTRKSNVFLYFTHRILPTASKYGHRC